MQSTEKPRRQKMVVFAGVPLTPLLGTLDQAIVGPAMSKIVRELGGTQLLTRAFTVYSLMSTIVASVVGKLSDLYGCKRFYVGAVMADGMAVVGDPFESRERGKHQCFTGAIVTPMPMTQAPDRHRPQCERDGITDREVLPLVIRFAELSASAGVDARARNHRFWTVLCAALAYHDFGCESLASALELDAAPVEEILGELAGEVFVRCVGGRWRIA